MPLSALIDLKHIPPGGWKYTQAETDSLIHGGDFYDLVEKVRKHRHLNHLATGLDLDAQVQAQICERLPIEARLVYCRDPQVHLSTEVTHEVSYGDVKHFLLTVGNTRRFVKPAEATRRAEICVTCPKNIGIAGCTPCRNLVGLVFNVIGHRATPFDRNLRACGVCGCELKAAVHIPLEAFPTTPNYQYPDWCWHLDPTK